MSGPSSPSAPGYLWVLSDPGESATLEEFQDWYDNEHVPLRMQHIPEFLTGARYEASDSLSPRWSAAYDIKSCSLFSDPKYTKLRANRSPREGELVQRLGVLDRRTCETLHQTSQPIKEVREVAKSVVTIAGDEEIREEELESLKTVQGWKRSSSHKVYDSLIIGHMKEPKSNVAPKFVVVHEFDSETYVDTPEYEKAVLGKKEVRRWKLYKATPNTANSN
ncbi:hypothetical protein JCM5350_000232 [Sporobolomyces pararoseus]